jgi:hypothetical protein
MFLTSRRILRLEFSEKRTSAEFDWSSVSRAAQGVTQGSAKLPLCAFLGDLRTKTYAISVKQQLISGRINFVAINQNIYLL